MEVHAHTHTPRKKWTHYLWEFLMLFLAVFCGFQAENIREQKVERHREKDYIKSFINNVKADTAELRWALESNRLRLSFLDSLVAMKKTDLALPENIKLVYQHYLNSRFFPDFISNDATMLQLKNSGNLRLIKKIMVADKILSYDALNKIITERSELLRSATIRTGQAASPLMDLTITRDSLFYNKNMLLQQPASLSKDTEKLRSFFNTVTEEARIAAAYIRFLSAHYKQADSLIHLMQKEYNLNPESN
ncbi:MAG TPA: hypothetical protein VI548_11545 [Chitinophagaceae bacterium]|nr:hypothetical protein [Chitinophagaceae bacterium]